MKTPLEIRKWAKAYALEQIEIQKKQFRSWGVMGDWENYYKTMDPQYESLQIQVFFEMFQKGFS